MSNSGNRATAVADALSDLDREANFSLRPFHRSAPTMAQVAADLVIPTLLAAEEAKPFADSWRGFEVGAAAAAMCFGAGGTRSWFLHGANVKPQEKSEVNVHAEHTIMIKAARRHAKLPDTNLFIPTLAVVGDLQNDQQSKQKLEVLHPCGICREAFKDPESPIDNRTLFVMANPSFTVVEWTNTEGLHLLHRFEDDSLIGHAEFSQRPTVLKPASPNHRGIVDPSMYDSSEVHESEQEFDTKVRRPVQQYVQSILAN